MSKRGTPSITYKPRGETAIPLPLIPNSYARPLYLMVFQMGSRHPCPPISPKRPPPTVVIGNFQKAKIAGIIRVRLHHINMPNHLGQLGKQRIPIPVSAHAAARLIAIADLIAAAAPANQRRRRQKPKQRPNAGNDDAPPAPRQPGIRPLLKYFAICHYAAHSAVARSPRRRPE